MAVLDLTRKALANMSAGVARARQGEPALLGKRERRGSPARSPGGSHAGPGRERGPAGNSGRADPPPGATAQAAAAPSGEAGN